MLTAPGQDGGNVAEAARGTGAVPAGMDRLRTGTAEARSALRGLRGATGDISRQGETLRAEFGTQVARLRQDGKAA